MAPASLRSSCVVSLRLQRGPGHDDAAVPQSLDKLGIVRDVDAGLKAPGIGFFQPVAAKDLGSLSQVEVAPGNRLGGETVVAGALDRVADRNRQQGRRRARGPPRRRR